MEYRTLGRSGFKVPVLSLGTGTFGGGGEFFKAWGQTDVAEATRLVDVCLDAGLTMFDSADVYSGGAAEEILGQADQGPAGPGDPLHQGHLRDRPRAQRRRLVPLPLGPGRRGEPRAPRDRLHRPLPAPRLRRPDAGRGDAGNPGRPGAGGEGPLRRLLELLGLAPDEVLGRVRTVRPPPLRGAPGVLLPDRARLRVGADAAGAGPGRGVRRLEPARLGEAHRESPPGAPLPETSRLRSKLANDKGPPVSDEHVFRVVDALEEVAGECGKTVAQVALNWLLQRPTVSNVIIGARNEEQLRQNLGAVGWDLSPGQVARLDAASAVTPAYPYWHQVQFADRNPPPVASAGR